MCLPYRRGTELPQKGGAETATRASVTGSGVATAAPLDGGTVNSTSGEAEEAAVPSSGGTVPGPSAGEPSGAVAPRTKPSGVQTAEDAGSPAADSYAGGYGPTHAGESRVGAVVPAPENSDFHGSRTVNRPPLTGRVKTTAANVQSRGEEGVQCPTARVDRITTGVTDDSRPLCEVPEACHGEAAQASPEAPEKGECHAKANAVSDRRSIGAAEDLASPPPVWGVRRGEFHDGDSATGPDEVRALDINAALHAMHLFLSYDGWRAQEICNEEKIREREQSIGAQAAVIWRDNDAKIRAWYGTPSFGAYRATNPAPLSYRECVRRAMMLRPPQPAAALSDGAEDGYLEIHGEPI